MFLKETKNQLCAVCVYIYNFASRSHSIDMPTDKHGFAMP